ncbi:hypothetical protein BgiBS90_023435, partial [Biomphalaria glabrata]
MRTVSSKVTPPLLPSHPQPHQSSLGDDVKWLWLQTGNRRGRRKLETVSTPVSS